MTNPETTTVSFSIRRALMLGTLMLAAILALGAGNADAPFAPSTLEDHVSFLASDALAGRLTGSPGAKAAADYIIERLEELGATPLPGNDGFRTTFDYTSGSRDTGSEITVTRAGRSTSSKGEANLLALTFSDNATVSGPVVFAGYGLSVPEGTDKETQFGYDSYFGLDVKDKVVVVLRYQPEDTDQATRAHLARYSGLRYKAMTAREHGAAGLLVVTGPHSPNAGETIPIAFDTAAAGSGITAASISGEVAQALFAASDTSLADAQKALDTANPHATGFDLPEVEVTLNVAIERQRSTGYNVVGVLPGGRGDVAEPWVVLGAHYDHLGTGRSGNSLARDSEKGGIHPGADDNASGVAAVLEAGRFLAGRERARNIVLAFWSGEELGLLGATDFVNDKDLDPTATMAYVNFDMVGRSTNNKLSVQAVGSSPEWKKILERRNVPVGFDLQLVEDPYLPTDSAAFDRADVPTLNFFTGSHADYHRPSDTADLLNYEDLARVARLGALVALDLAQADEPLEFARVERKRESGGDRDTVRAYTGTIPDYATEVEGLLLGGVMPGGPAEEAGLKEGDVIVRFGEQTITNIYDYTYALDAAKPDVPLEVIYMRGDERIETTLTPRARK